MRRVRPPAMLALEDGSVFHGESVGADGESGGEVVFNTSLSGYQEILTDPSYKGQIVTMTATQIGNYGISRQDDEAEKPWVEGFIVREMSPIASNFRSDEALDHFLARTGVVAIEGIDTRAVTRKLREKGALRGVVSTTATDAATLVDRARTLPPMEGRDLVLEVTRRREQRWTQSTSKVEFLPELGHTGRIYDLVVVDYGAKWNILRNLTSVGFKVTVVPATTTADTILAKKPHAVFLSNGPGDPAAMTYAHKLAAGLLGKLPVLGICLGHQILGHAFGGKTFKLAFGHHGGNHPVMDLRTRKVEITAQNHGFAVDPELFERGEVEWTHKNLNDGSVEGMAHRKLPVMSVQYHPEAAPGPHDSLYLFREFRAVLDRAYG
ncbi:MAG: glutamine-hydrolyzing carbamoyl-phosphate synthase small subunit [Planctomycetes bacterium]|nr:glutamine-hydrolyzing carbamoyl-phosphate synthase small subunit [Planctomycetota bacterium]